jgi:hypothetical protein
VLKSQRSDLDDFRQRHEHWCFFVFHAAETVGLKAAFFISISLGSAESDLYWSVGATFIQIIDESTFIHPNVCTFIQNRALPP